MSHQDLVRAFHEKFSIPVRDKPGVPSDERVRLRLRLIAEEFLELLDSCDDGQDDRFSEHWLEAQCALDFLISRVRSENVALPDFVDALVDLEYVIHGGALEVGVDTGPVMAEVHKANMRKDGGPKREDSKILKPPGWEPPDIAGCLRAQGWDEFDAMAQSVGELPTSMLAGSPKLEREPTILDASGHRVIGPETCDHGVKFDAEAARNLSASEVRKRWPRHWGACPLGCGYVGIAYASWEHYGAGDW